MWEDETCRSPDTLRGGAESRPWPDRDVAKRLLLLKINVIPCLQHQHFKEPPAGIQPGLACNNAIQASLQEHKLSEVSTCVLLCSRQGRLKDSTPAALLLHADVCTCASSLQKARQHRTVGARHKMLAWACCRCSAALLGCLRFLLLLEGPASPSKLLCRCASTFLVREVKLVLAVSSWAWLSGLLAGPSPSPCSIIAAGSSGIGGNLIP